MSVRWQKTAKKWLLLILREKLLRSWLQLGYKVFFKVFRGFTYWFMSRRSNNLLLTTFYILYQQVSWSPRPLVMLLSSAMISDLNMPMTVAFFLCIAIAFPLVRWATFLWYMIEFWSFLTKCLILLEPSEDNDDVFKMLNVFSFYQV